MRYKTYNKNKRFVDVQRVHKIQEIEKRFYSLPLSEGFHGRQLKTVSLKLGLDILL